jgi:putative two-component system response regulator
VSPTDPSQPSADARPADDSADHGDALASGAAQHDRLNNALLLAMATMAEPNEAGHHIQRIGLYVQALANQLRQNAPYADQWPDATLDAMVRASALHDIGNSAVPDRILLKPGALSQEELDLVRNHPVIGRDIIDQVRRTAGGTSVLLDMAHQIIYGHHERWDGQGYPQGLANDENPTPALVMAIVDTYDAMTSDRVYRAGMPHDKAIQLIFQERGAQFAPDMVDALIEIQHEFADIARRLADSETDLQKKFDYLAKAIAESP